MASEESDFEVEEQDLPPAAECERRCQRFADVTGTDTALAMFFLQDRLWDLDRALNAFFEENTRADCSSEGKEQSTSVNSFTFAESKPGQSGEMKSGAIMTPKPHRVRIMSWNIDGLSVAHLKQRAKVVADTIKGEAAEVVFLQEVVPGNEVVLKEHLQDYTFLTGGTGSREGYYTAVLLHKQHTILDDFSIVPFTSSHMGRNLIIVNSIVKGIPMTLITGHLESTNSYAAERKRQFQMLLRHVKDSPGYHTVVFGGDLNIRDKEVDSSGGLPEGIVDLWEATGSRKEARYTWDTFRNDNLGLEGKCRSRLRFDRLFLRQCISKARLKPVYFELVGLQRLPGVQCFPSDHWGILTHLDILTSDNE